MHPHYGHLFLVVISTGFQTHRVWARVCRGTGKGTPPLTLQKPIPVRQVTGFHGYCVQVQFQNNFIPTLLYSTLQLYCHGRTVGRLLHSYDYGSK